MSHDYLRYREGVALEKHSAPRKCTAGTYSGKPSMCPNKPEPYSAFCAQCRAAGLARVLGTGSQG